MSPALGGRFSLVPPGKPIMREDPLTFFSFSPATVIPFEDNVSNV